MDDLPNQFPGGFYCALLKNRSFHRVKITRVAVRDLPRFYYHRFPFKFSSSLFLLSHTPVLCYATSHNTGSRNMLTRNIAPCFSVLSLVFFRHRPNYTSGIVVIYREYNPGRGLYSRFLSLFLSRAITGATIRGNIIRDKVGRSREKIMYDVIL